MKVAVTGGTGFLGRALLQLVVPQASEVRVLVRRPQDEAWVRSMGAIPVRGDLLDPGGCDGLAVPDAVVYHLAAHVDLSGEWSAFRRTTIEGTRRLLAAILPQRPRRIVYASSAGVYLMPDRPGPVCADTAEALPSPYNLYGRAKLAAEQIVQQQCDTAGCSWSIVRLGFLYGPENRAMFQHFIPMARKKRLHVIGRGTNRLCSLYVDDAARAMVLAGTHVAADRRIYDAASDERVTQRDYLNAMCDALNLPRPELVAPYHAAFFTAGVVDMVAHLLKRRAPFTRTMIALMAVDQRVDCSALRQELGWAPQVRFQDGMERIRQWYAQQQVPPASTEMS